MLNIKRLCQATCKIQEAPLSIGWADCTAYVPRPGSDFRPRKESDSNCLYELVITHRPIQRCNRRSPTTYRLPTMVRNDPSRSSKVDDFRLIWKGVCDLLLLINSYLSPISYRFWDTASFRLETHIVANRSIQLQISKCLCLKLHCQNFARKEPWHRANYCVA